MTARLSYLALNKTAPRMYPLGGMGLHQRLTGRIRQPGGWQKWIVL